MEEYEGFRIGDKVRLVTGEIDKSETNYTSKDVLEIFDFQPTDIYSISLQKEGRTEVLCVTPEEIEKVESSPENEPKKYDDNKPMMHLVRPEFIKGMAESLTYGALKYDEPRGSEPNYMKGEGFHYSKVYDSLQRHLTAFQSGESYDVGESDKHHLLMAACNIMFLYMYEISDKGIDDRRSFDKRDR